MKQPILTVPHEKLRQISQPITTFDHHLVELVLDLEETLKKAKNPEGVGLALPQIGILLRGFALYLDHRMRIYLNPEILDQSDETTFGPSQEHPILEGCLSIPHLYGPVERAKKIKFKAYDEKGREHIGNLSNFAARVFLHEYDHLDGILFTDYTKKHNLPLYFHDLERDEFVPIEDPSKIIRW